MNPWDDGYHARYNGQSQGQNPFKPDPLVPYGEYQEWDDGWVFADEEIKEGLNGA